MDPIRSALLTAKRRRHYDDGGTPVAKKDAAPVQVAAAPAADVAAAAPAADTSTAQAPGISQADIENLYKTVANRSSDPEGMAYWQQQAANGMSLDEMQSQFQQAAQDPFQEAKAATMVNAGAVQSYGDNIPQPPRKPIYLQNFDYSQYDNPLDARYAFLSKAFNPTIAAAMMGNYGIESFNNPNQLQTNNGAANGTPIFDANNMPKGYGAAMWGGTRLTNPNGGPNKMGLFDFAQAYGYDPNTTEGQDRFAVYELTQNPEYADAYKGLIGAGTDVNKATQIFGDQYEGPKNLSKTLEDRQATAQMYLDNYNNPSALSSADQAEIAKTKSGMLDPAFQQYAAKKAADAAAAAAAAKNTTTSTDMPMIDTSVTQPIIDQTGVGGNQNIMNMLNSNTGTDFQNLGVTGLNNYNFTTIPSSGGVPSGGFNNGVSIDNNVMQNFGFDPNTLSSGGAVHHALRLAHHYARGGYADGGDPPPDTAPDDNVQPGESVLMRERQTITPSSLARSFTPPEDTIEQNLGPQQQNIMQNYPQMLSDKMVGAGQAVANMPGKMLDLAKYPGQVMSGEQTFDPHSDADIQKALDLAGMTMSGGIGGAPEGAVLGSGPISKTDLFDYSRLHEIPKMAQFDLPRTLPPRGVPARITDIVADKDVQNKMLGVISEGQKMGGANWYNADPLRENFVRQLGSNQGNEAFRKYMDFVAATSPRSDVGTNVRNASYYYQRHMGGEGMPEIGEKNPQPYGHMAQRLHQMNAQRVSGAGWDPLNNPKPASFVENLVGNQAPVTVDTHAFRLPAILAEDPRYLETAFQVNKDAPKQNIQKMVGSGEIPLPEAVKRAAYWQAQPKANEYGAMEQYYKKLGQELGLTPAQTQASAWVGGGKLTGLASDESKPFLKFFEDRIHKTATETKMDPRDVLNEFIKGKMRLKSKGGTVNNDSVLMNEYHQNSAPEAARSAVQIAKQQAGRR